MIEDNLVLLSKRDTKEDSDGNLIEFKEGITVKIFHPNKDDNGKEDNLIAEGIVELNTCGDKYSWTASAKWNCRINEEGIYHESEILSR